MECETSFFTPVIPNITDDTMVEERGPVNVKKGSRTKNIKPPVSDWRPMAEQIAIGLLAAVIIILLVILVYQVYKYYTVNEINDDTTTSKETKSETDATATAPMTTGSIPQHVRDLDSAVLKQYINKKPKTANKKIITTPTPHTTPVHGASTGEAIDDAHEKQLLDNVKTDNINEDTISREEFLEDLKRGVEEDQEKNRILADSIFDQEPDDLTLINDFDDNVSVISDSGGCQFELTKGKNKGSLCGRKRVNDHTCSRHTL
jgi:hypothetical protein